MALVFAVGNFGTHYGGLATFELGGRLVDQVPVLAVEGGTGTEYERNVAVSADGAITPTTVIEVGTEGPTSNIVNYRLLREGREASPTGQN